MSKNHPPPKTDAALVFTNDDFLEVSRIMYHLCMASRRSLIRPFLRDTADNRWLGKFLENNNIKEAHELGNLMITSKYIPFVYYAGIDRLLSFDMDWLLAPECFLEIEPIKNAISLWRNDLRNISSQKIFSKEKTQKQILSDPKVLHFFANETRKKEAELIGLPALSLYKPAAPQEFLKENHECLHKDRIVFLETFQPPLPSAAAMECLKQNPTFDALRQIAKEEIFQDALFLACEKKNSQIRALIEEIVAAKINAPSESATALIVQKKSQYPDVVRMLEEDDVLLGVSALIKSVFKYDIPLIITRLHGQNLLDVYGEEKGWEVYGVQVKGKIQSRYITQLYQSYIAHLYIPDLTTEETLHERLFEAAACGRCVFTIANSDNQNCFDANQEIILVENADDLSQKISQHLSHADELLTRGEKCRQKIASQHTWDHRIQEIYKLIKK